MATPDEDEHDRRDQSNEVEIEAHCEKIADNDGSKAVTDSSTKITSKEWCLVTDSGDEGRWVRLDSTDSSRKSSEDEKNKAKGRQI